MMVRYDVSPIFRHLFRPNFLKWNLVFFIHISFSLFGVKIKMVKIKLINLLNIFSINNSWTYWNNRINEYILILYSAIESNIKLRNYDDWLIIIYIIYILSIHIYR